MCVEPCLKWPGGKRWLAPTLAPLLAAELQGKYFEPFFGGGAVFLNIGSNNSCLSDINNDLIHFLSVVRDNPEKLIHHVWRFSNTRECYYKVRSSKPRSDLGKAARFLYLNRTAWGGIYRLNQNGEFNVPFGNSDRKICSKQSVFLFAKSLRNANIQKLDFETAIDTSQNGDVIYADPPYTSRGQNNGFIRYNERLFSWADQMRLAKAASRARHRGVFVCVSGVFHRHILELYRNWWAVRVDRTSLVARQPEHRRVFSEVIIFSRLPNSKAIRQKLDLQKITDNLLAKIPVVCH